MVTVTPAASDRAVFIRVCVRVRSFVSRDVTHAKPSVLFGGDVRGVTYLVWQSSYALSEDFAVAIQNERFN